MKGIHLCLLVCGVWAQAPAPYAPSGWRPNGPAFQLPQRNPQPQYLPPLDPRNPQTPASAYGTPEEDVSVQGLPTQEQLPIFQLSPVNGQQYVGPSFSADVKQLDQSYQQSQYEAQQQRYREFARQRQLDSQANSNQPIPQIPRQFVRTTTRPSTTVTTAKPDDTRSTQPETTTEPLDLNEGEALDESSKQEPKEKVTVEVSQQKIQEYPAEFFFNQLAQLQLQPQLQLGQIRAPVFFQAPQGVSQKQVTGYDAETHLAALPSILAQQQLLRQAQLVQAQPQVVQGYQNPAYFVPQQESGFVAQSEPQYPTQYPANQLDVQAQPGQFPQVQAQPVVFQSQLNQVQPNYAPQQTSPDDQEQIQPAQPQFVYQQAYPQYQPLPANQYPQEASIQPQLSTLNDYQRQFFQKQVIQNPQEGSLQSGLDVNQQGNAVDETEDKDAEEDPATAVAVATAFGARTQPRNYSKYGAPAAPSSAAPNPGYPTTTEADQENADETPVVAEATAVANGKKKSAKLRSRRIRPTFVLDRSGHLVLAQQ